MKRVFATASSMALACAMVATVSAQQAPSTPDPNAPAIDQRAVDLLEREQDCHCYRLSGGYGWKLHSVERFDVAVSHGWDGWQHESVLDRQHRSVCHQRQRGGEPVDLQAGRR